MEHKQEVLVLVVGVASLLSTISCDCIVGHIDHGNSRRTPTVGEGEQLFWQCDFDFVHDPGNGESVCQDGTLVPPPQCRQIQYAPAGCPPELWGVRVTRRGNMCYVIYPNELRHDAAEDYCRESFGGRLLTITNRTMMDYVASILDHQGWARNCWCLGCCLFSSARKVWIGLYYSDTWRWTALDGVSPMYTNWKRGEGGTWIDGRKYERCATLYGGWMWMWYDEDCDDSYNFVCETDAVE